MVATGLKQERVRPFAKLERQPDITMGIGITDARLAVEINQHVARSFEHQDPLILRADLDGQVAAPASKVKRPFRGCLDGLPAADLAVSEGHHLVLRGHRPGTGDNPRRDGIERDQ